MKPKKRGRPRQILEPTVVASHNITVEQYVWLIEEGEKQKKTASDILREVLKKVMAKKSREKSRP